MSDSALSIDIPYAAYLSLVAHGYCALESANDALGEDLAIGAKVNATSKLGSTCTMRLIAKQQEVGIDRFTHIYAVAI